MCLQRMSFRAVQVWYICVGTVRKDCPCHAFDRVSCDMSLESPVVSHCEVKPLCAARFVLYFLVRGS
jgi:hypothetical protein